MGGVPVYRSRQMGSTDLLAKKAIEADEFRLCITPEGTRKPNREWKRGFYYIALKANIPIVLYGLDYERRLIKCTKMVVPTGDIEKDMQEIKEYFREFKGRHPEKFEY
jgi:1-acyl-sn-glycerol-3-phosphate acyltransferase